MSIYTLRVIIPDYVKDNGTSLYRLLKQSLPYINALNLPDTLTAELLKEKLYQDQETKKNIVSYWKIKILFLLFVQLGLVEQL